MALDYQTYGQQISTENKPQQEANWLKTNSQIHYVNTQQQKLTQLNDLHSSTQSQTKTWIPHISSRDFTCILLRLRCSALMWDGRLWRGTPSFADFGFDSFGAVVSVPLSGGVRSSGEVLSDLACAKMDRGNSLSQSCVIGGKTSDSWFTSSEGPVLSMEEQPWK